MAITRRSHQKQLQKASFRSGFCTCLHCIGLKIIRSSGKTPVRQPSAPSVQAVSPASRQTVPPPLPPIKYAAAAAAAVTQSPQPSVVGPPTAAVPGSSIASNPTSYIDSATVDSSASITSPLSNFSKALDSHDASDSFADGETDLSATIPPNRESTATLSNGQSI